MSWKLGELRELSRPLVAVVDYEQHAVRAFDPKAGEWLDHPFNLPSTKKDQVSCFTWAGHVQRGVSFASGMDARTMMEAESISPYPTLVVACSSNLCIWYPHPLKGFVRLLLFF